PLCCSSPNICHCQNSGIEKAFLFDVVSKIYIATDSSPVDMQSYELCCDMIDVVIDVSCIYGLREDGSGSAYDKESMAIIKLNNTTVLYLKEVTKFLALVCILREESFERKGLIDYNFHCFRKAIHEVFEGAFPPSVHWARRRLAHPAPRLLH
ncbi:ras-related GTP-binding protein C-like, partial [Micropterus salmoides]|uniref:ras-related GTP-binding protein C-like n=1 Tax=Micropterus salmoides TaxID=27706 RepID=UPI0018EDDBD1